MREKFYGISSSKPVATEMETFSLYKEKLWDFSNNK
jgi:hypothetical protein